MSQIESVELEIHSKSRANTDENEEAIKLTPYKIGIYVCSSIILLFYVVTTFINIHQELSQLIFGTIIIGINILLIIIDGIKSKNCKSVLNACCIKSNPFSCSKFTGKWIQIPIFIPTIIMINILMWKWFGDTGYVQSQHRIDSTATITFSYNKEINMMHTSRAHVCGNIGFFVFIAIILEAKFSSFISFVVFWSWWIFSYGSNRSGGRGASGTTHALFGSALVIQISHIYWFINNRKKDSNNFKKLLSVCNYYTQCIFIITLQQYGSYFYGIRNNLAHADGILFGIILTMLLMPVFDAWLIYNPYQITYKGKGKVLNLMNVIISIVGLILFVCYFEFPISS